MSADRSSRRALCRFRDHRPVTPDSRSVLLVVLLALLVAVTLSFLAASGSAAVAEGNYVHNDSNDTEAPTLGNASRVNDTAFDVTIVDNHDVDESTLVAEEFILSHGSIENISVSEAGRNATVRFVLRNPVDRENVTVVPTENAIIEDEDGNRLDTESAGAFSIVRNMDGVAPVLREFSVTDAAGGPATIRVAADEELGDFHVYVRGPEDELLDASDFEATEDSFTYELSYEPKADGNYTVGLSNITDNSGNTRPYRRDEDIVADLTPPDAVAILDLTNSQNLTMTFDGRNSADENSIASYDWNFDDGSTGSGKRVSHEFLPGNYTVTLTVTDQYGNAATDSVYLNLTTGSGNASEINESTLRERRGTKLNVTVERSGENVTGEAVLRVENARENETVTAGTTAGDGPLVAASPARLEALDIRLRTNRSFDLALSMAGNGSVSGAGGATDTVPIAGFTVVNTVPDEDVENATVRFSVEQSRLEEIDVTPENVSLYRLSDGGWDALPTRPLDGNTDTQPFQADSPGFSRFAILANVTRTPSLNLTGATVDSSTVAPEEQFTVTATVENTGDAGGNYTGVLTANGTVIANGTQSIPADSTAEIPLDATLPLEGTFQLTVNETDAGQITVASPESGENESEDTTGGEDESSEDESEDTTGGEDENESADTTSDSQESDEPQVVVTEATLGTEQVEASEVFAVNATVENRGNSDRAFYAGLEVDGEVVTTKTRPVPAGESRTIELESLLEENGTYNVSVNGTSAGTLQVGNESSDDGGGLLSPVLGILPVGLLQPLFLFVILPVAVIYGILKGLAIYLGY